MKLTYCFPSEDATVVKDNELNILSELCYQFMAILHYCISSSGVNFLEKLIFNGYGVINFVIKVLQTFSHVLSSFSSRRNVLS